MEVLPLGGLSPVGEVRAQEDAQLKEKVHSKTVTDCNSFRHLKSARKHAGVKLGFHIIIVDGAQLKPFIVLTLMIGSNGKRFVQHGRHLHEQNNQWMQCK